MRKDGTIRPLSSRRTRPFGEFLGQLGHAAMSNGDERVPRYDRAMFARRLQAAIDRLGLTYEETARRAREHLPPDARLSSVSVWQYARGKTFPRRMSYVEALSRVLEVTPNDLLLPAPGDDAAASEGGTIRPGPSEPHIRLEDLGNGLARLDLTLDLPWPVALQILQLAKGSHGQEGDEVSGRI